MSARRHLYDLRFQLATRQLTDYSQIAQTRRSIARLLTVQTEREFGDAAAAGVGAGRRREVMSAGTGAHTRGSGRPRSAASSPTRWTRPSSSPWSAWPAIALYKRVIRLTTKFKAHDERNEARIGDTVRIEESRPLSATKRWRMVEIVARASEGSTDAVVAAEPATEEAIHVAAHPGPRACRRAVAADEVPA